MSELETYARVLDGLHRELSHALDGLSVAALDWRPPAAESNSIFVLAAHTLDSAAYWFLEAIGGQPLASDNLAYMGDKDAGTLSAAGVDLAAWRAGLDASHARNMQALRALTPGDLERPLPAWTEGRLARWAIQHVIDHTARHLGQIELTRGLWEQQQR